MCFSDLARLGLVRECWFSRHLSFASADRSQGRGAFYSVRLFIQHLFKEPGKPFDAVPPTEQLLRNAFVAAMGLLFVKANIQSIVQANYLYALANYFF